MQETRLTLYDRLKPEYKESMAELYKNRKHTHDSLVKALSEEYYFTEVKYGDAFDIMNECNLDFLGYAFINQQEK
jgi:hypothetical protein|tara:strand:- start:254 stop:478 length:225 start_codon:yes stop_codon:yes gene_type:complete